MANLKKLTGITGLNVAHPSYSKVARYIVFDTTIKDLVSNQIYTTTAALVNDSDIGDNVREFDATADAMTPSIPIGINNTVMVVYKHNGPTLTSQSINAFMFNFNSGGNAFILEAGAYSAYDYRLTRRGSAGTTFTTQFKPYNASAGTAGMALRREPHATAIDFVSGSTSFWQNGVQVPVFGGTSAPVFTLSTTPLNVQFAQSVAGPADQVSYRVAAIVVFNAVLTDEEKASVTNDPWELVVGALPLEVSLSAALTPGATITATFTNYESLPTSVTVVDSRGNDLVLPLTATGATTATFTVPALASSTAGQEYVQYGAVNLTFGGKTISSTFAPVAPVGYVTLAAPVATNAFEAWGPDVPVAGEQLSSQGNFDVNGNFTGADPEAVYTCWITRLNGANYRFTVQQGDAEPPETVAAPSMSPDAGSYVNNVTITITTNTDGATTRYTTDGSDVTTSSILYSVPFTLTSSATVKARSFKAGLADSTQTSQTYVLTSAPVSGVPTMSPWQPTLTHALRINQIIDATGINVTKLAVTQEDYVDILTVNQIIVALNLTASIPLLGVNQPAYVTALTINAIIEAIS